MQMTIRIYTEDSYLSEIYLHESEVKALHKIHKKGKLNTDEYIGLSHKQMNKIIIK